MIVYFKENNEKNRNIEMVDHETLTPTIPKDLTMKEQTLYYKEKGLGFIALNYEIGGKIFNYNLCFNDKNEFIGLVPKVEE